MLSNDEIDALWDDNPTVPQKVKRREIANKANDAVLAKLTAGVEVPEAALFTHELLQDGKPNGVHLGVETPGICEQAYTEGETSEKVSEWVLIESAIQYGASQRLAGRERAIEECANSLTKLITMAPTDHQAIAIALAQETIRALAASPQEQK